MAVGCDVMPGTGTAFWNSVGTVVGDGEGSGLSVGVSVGTRSKSVGDGGRPPGPVVGLRTDGGNRPGGLRVGGITEGRDGGRKIGISKMGREGRSTDGGLSLAVGVGKGHLVGGLSKSIIII